MRARTVSLNYVIGLAALTALVVLVAALFLQAGLSFGAVNALSLPDQLSLLQTSVGHAKEIGNAWLSDHYQRAPTLVLGLAAVVLVPIVSLLAALVRTLSGQPAAPQSSINRAEPTATHAFGERGAAMPVPDRAACNAGRPVWPSKAMVELRDPTGQRRPARIALSQPVVQIGRSDDVDIVIRDPTVHRHHATIHCTEDAEYMVTDMSAGTGNGVVVNGHPVFQHQIFNGDEIRLGRARLKFLTAQT